MNFRLYTSPNAVYTVLYDNQSMSIYKNDRLMYTWDFNFQDFHLVGISDYGRIACMADNKFYIFEKEGYITGPIVTVSPACQEGNVSIKNNIKFDNRGFFICYEKIIEKSFLNKISYYSEIFIYNLNTGHVRSWWNFTKDNKKQLDLIWNISKDIKYMAFLEKYYISIKKDYYKLHLLDMTRDAQVYTVQINEIYDPHIMINSYGDVLLHCQSVRINRLLRFNNKGEKFEIILPNSFYLLDIGKKNFVIKHKYHSHFIFMNFSRHAEYPVDLTLLDNNEIKYNLFIKDNDEIVLLYKIPDETVFCRIEAPLEDFLIHIKRWQMVLKEQERQKKLYKKTFEEKDSVIQLDTSRARMLTQSALKHHNIRKDKVYSKVIQIEQLMGKLNEQYLFQGLSEQQYKDNRAKLMDSINKLDMVAGKLNIEIKEGDFPPDLMDLKKLKEETVRLVGEKKMSLEDYNKWDDKIRIMKIKEKEKDKLEREAKKDKEPDEEQQKIVKLLELLDERLIKGEISEALYKELRGKYYDKLEAMKNKTSLQHKETTKR